MVQGATHCTLSFPCPQFEEAKGAQLRYRFRSRRSGPTRGTVVHTGPTRGTVVHTGPIPFLEGHGAGCRPHSRENIVVIERSKDT
jgi:hypothetical protein